MRIALHHRRIRHVLDCRKPHTTLSPSTSLKWRSDNTQWRKQKAWHSASSFQHSALVVEAERCNVRIQHTNVAAGTLARPRLGLAKKRGGTNRSAIRICFLNAPGKWGVVICARCCSSRSSSSNASSSLSRARPSWVDLSWCCGGCAWPTPG